METNSFEAKMDNESFISSLDKMNSTLPESISEEDNGSMAEDNNSPSFLMQNSEPELSNLDKLGNRFLGSEKKDAQSFYLPKDDQVKPMEIKKGGLLDEQDPSFMDAFLIELIHRIKNSFSSIYHAMVLSMDQNDNAEIGRHLHTQVEEDIKKIDSVLNSVLNFININTPLTRKNTLYTILEEILESNEKHLQKKNIKVIKKYGKELPDTFIHPEQVRFIFHSLLQYAILSTPPNGSIALLMDTSDANNGTSAEKTPTGNNRGYIEVLIGFNGDGKPVNKLENLSETPGDQKEGITDLILKLAKEILQRNHGMMIETHGKRLKTLINLRFPIERRKVVYYDPIVL
jgi:nitrogen-specific signal transduction histidine kinase